MVRAALEHIVIPLEQLLRDGHVARARGEVQWRVAVLVGLARVGAGEQVVRDRLGQEGLRRRPAP